MSELVCESVTLHASRSGAYFSDRAQQEETRPNPKQKPIENFGAVIHRSQITTTLTTGYVIQTYID